MSSAEIAVTVTGAVAIVWVLWYFLVPPKPRPRAPAAPAVSAHE
jgi:hypothetical protein